MQNHATMGTAFGMSASAGLTTHAPAPHPPPPLALHCVQVCRHHAAAVAQGQGNCTQFKCPYHGWTYDTLGRLRKATRLKGIEGFRASANGLLPIELSCLGPFMFLRIGSPRRQQQQQQQKQKQQVYDVALAADAQHSTAAGQHQDQQQQEQQAQQGQQEQGRQQQQQAPGSTGAAGVAAWLGRGGAELLRRLQGTVSMVPVAQRQYDLRCNWKVGHRAQLPTSHRMQARGATSQRRSVANAACLCAGVL
jgi:hypothetical protein